MAEWLVEHGIGERRALLIDRGEVVKAQIHWPGELTAGDVIDAQLTGKAAGSQRGVVTLDNGTEVLADHLPRHVTEGMTGQVRITRAPIAERGRLKRAQARWLEQPQAASAAVPDVAGRAGDFPAGMWEEVWHAASSGRIAFPGGEILCAVTPAMTVIDIDGDLPARELALAAIPAIGQAVRWFALGGNIGIDFPSLSDKADRRRVDQRLAAALEGWPHERTAMNGFGFVQLVARLDGPSLLHRFQTARTAMCARFALRAAERVAGPGVTLLRVHPALKAKMHPDWLAEMTRRTGRPVRIDSDPALALEAPQAQIVPHDH